MEPSAAVFESTGMAYQLAQYLVTAIKNGQPDLGELRSHGISQELAVSVCESIAKRHARRNAALAAMKPKPVPAKPQGALVPSNAPCQT